jgi:esterase/lipase
MTKPLDLREFKIPIRKLAPLEVFKTRSGDALSYRMYPAWSENLLVLYHGVGSDSRYLCVLASQIAEKGFATVVTPDFRGHGASLGVSDKIQHEQLEIDLEELLIHIKIQRAVSRVALGGHSLGGGFALRVATSTMMQKHFAAFFAMAPYLPGTMQDDLGGWIGEGENGQGFVVNVPEIFRTGQEKTIYSEEYLQAARCPLDQLTQLDEVTRKKIYVSTGEFDQVASPEKQSQFFNQFGVPFEIAKGCDHLNVVAKFPSENMSHFEF